MNETAVVSLQ